MSDSNYWFDILPKHWSSANLKLLSSIRTGGTPSRDKLEYWENGTINWMSSGDVNKKFITELSEKSLKKDTIILVPLFCLKER